MDPIKISGLPAAAALGVGDLVPVVQGVTTKKATFTQVLDLVFAGLAHVLPIARGGTGQAAANDALNALLPAQAGQATKFLQTDGADTAWAVGGGVASVGNADGTLTVATVGAAVDVKLALDHANVWTGQQSFSALTGGSTATATMAPTATGQAASFTATGANPAAATMSQDGQAAGFSCGGNAFYCGLAAMACWVPSGLAKFDGGLELSGSLACFGHGAAGQQASGGAVGNLTGGADTTNLLAIGGTTADATLNNNFTTLWRLVDALYAGLINFGLFN